MSALRKGRSTTAARPRRTGAILALVLSLLFVIGGIETIALGAVRMQDASRLSAAPVCTSRQQVGCRLEERVTITGLTTESFGRGNSVPVVKVQTPDGTNQSVYAGDNDAGLLSRLRVHEVVNAELWNGYVVRLADGSGHYLLSDDNPTANSLLMPIIGVIALLGGGWVSALLIRSLRRPRLAY